MKQYLFTFTYTENEEKKKGTVLLVASNMLHANNLFKVIYSPDRCCVFPEAEVSGTKLNVITIEEMPNIITNITQAHESKKK
jgi:hypothetical protein